MSLGPYLDERLGRFTVVPDPDPRPASPGQWGREHLHLERVDGPVWATPHVVGGRIVEPWFHEFAGCVCARCEEEAGDIRVGDGSMACPSCAAGRSLPGRLRASGLPWRWHDVHSRTDWGRFGVDVDVIREQVEAGDGVLLCGPTRRGKTHLASLLAWDALSRGLSLLWLDWSTVLRKLRRAKPGEDWPEPPWASADGLVVLDDLGVTKPTDWNREQLQALLDEAHPDAVFVATSNLPAECDPAKGMGLRRWAGDRCHGRLMERCRPVVFRGADR